MPEGLPLIIRYFPEITDTQKDQFESLGVLYQHWNARINLISRKDQQFLYERHVLHALAIAKFVRFLPGSEIVDIGTGGGFPGLPLAIMFPEVQFDLVDSIGKKIRVVKEICAELDLLNVSAYAERMEKIPGKYDFVTGRAVTSLDKIWDWVSNKFNRENRHSIKNGLIYLKGGEFQVETEVVKGQVSVQSISQYFEEDFFRTKKIVHISPMW